MARLGWREIVLIASLMANALFIGVLVGGSLAGLRLAGPIDHHPRGGGSERTLSPRFVMRALPSERRDEIRATMRASRDEVVELLTEMRSVRGAALDAMDAEPFDPDSVRAALAAEREAGARLREHGHEFVISVLERLSPEERAALVGEMRERADRRSRRRGPRRHRRPVED